MNKSLLTKNNKNVKILLVVLGIVVVLAVVLSVVIYKNYGSNGQAEEMQQGEDLAASLSPEDGELRDVHQVTESDVPDEPTEIAHVPDGNFQVTMTTEWNYPDINTPAEDSYVENARNNTLDTTFSVVLADDESVILYESPLLPVGSYTAGIPLKIELAPGSYECVAIYTLYQPGSTESSGSIRVGLTINIG